jgi:hypothetical protein
MCYLDAESAMVEKYGTYTAKLRLKTRLSVIIDPGDALCITCLASAETKCSFSFPDAFDKSNLIQMFQHFYVYHVPIYDYITKNSNKWVKEKTVNIFFSNE